MTIFVKIKIDRFKKLITQILLIDDDSDDHEIFSLALELVDNKCICRFAKDGIDALEILNCDIHFNPSLIFLDVNMPRMNGIECLPELKKIKRLRNVPVIMYSTSSDEDIIKQLKDLGAADYIVKPSRIETLSELLAQTFRHHLQQLNTK